MNVGEYGVVFAFSTSYNMSVNSALAIIFTKPSGATLTVTDPDVTCPAVPISTTRGVFAANVYLKYVFQNGDVDEAGEWRVRAHYTGAGGVPFLISDQDVFTINP